MRKYIFIPLLTLILGAYLMADTLSLSFFQSATDNIFQNKYDVHDQLSNFNLYVEKNLSRFTVFMQGNYSYLFENPDLTYYVHDLGLDYLHPISEKSAFYLSGIGSGAFYRSDYSDFNYFSVNLFAAFKSYLSQTSIVKSNYSFEYKSYPSSSFDFISHSLWISVDKYLQTKTTLRAEMNWGYKHFLNPYLSEESTLVVGNQPQYGGNGKGYRYSRMPSQFVTMTESQDQGIQVFSLAGLIAQGLGNIAGINISGLKQWTLSGKNPFTYIEEFYSVENPSFDRFSWYGYQISSQLTILAPWSIQAKIGYTISEKTFPGIESMNLDDEPLGMTRKDKRKQLEARLEKNISKFSVFLAYFYIHNSSNDLFFEWNGQFISAGIEWNVSFGDKK